mmetsp:Transcript_4154/g.6258  ORF Transcript_4154/g.6258 Transcript_4154/m.6258 type:complete len:149 (+) Transcript_4154:294-740(+)|eukprot:CAMPEP_0201546040 /NCGR_PEP_ID=MMETSP0173_2-20130828/2438_1 /ASSEMBLY_ACC=CAM_ASM_000268 /TAXON_ID=218659 /ORGANISM="Vexillifera sp., Strain DIVA3 564/2" /LENGTH=148 /DNA_ID=CAMNT_0047954625 /DNA_START=265 /DNA_END=711 /DNA_ORIENTATION=-
MSSNKNEGLVEYSEANGIKKGGYCLIKDKPCKVVELHWSKPGKHGAGKIRMVGIDMFTGKKYESAGPSTHQVEVPIVNRQEVQLLDITPEGYACVLDGDDTRELKLPAYPEELADKIKEAFEDGKDVDLSVVSSMGIEQVTDFKIQKQ